jgi:Stress responsive A/B Barrel Domain
MLVHSVYFWLKPELSDEQRDKFWELVRSLSKIASARQCYIGTPASTERAVIDSSYSCALIIVFDDLAGHDAYQVDPIHDRFRDECSSLWSKVLIYDAVTQ